MSAVSARSVSHAKGVDRVRALQRVLYRCAKQDRDRRFHALYDKVARSDVLWRAWGEVRANRGAPGVDGVSIDDVLAAGVGEFLDELARQLRAGTYRPRSLRSGRLGRRASLVGRTRGEWRNRQTRRIQDPVQATGWGFNSPLAHALDVSGHGGRMSHAIVDT